MMRRTGAAACLVAAAILIFSCPAFSQSPAAADEQICNVRADAALGLEDYPTAIKLHRDWLRFHPNDALAHYHLGFAYGMAGRSAEEIDEYREAVVLGLHRWDLWVNLGLAYGARGEWTQAAAALTQATRLDPAQAAAHFNLALVYEAEQRLGQALAEITIARQLAPQDPAIENTRAIICAETGDLRCALKLWTQQARAGYQPARANLALLRRLMSPGAGLARLIARSPLVTERQRAMCSSQGE